LLSWGFGAGGLRFGLGVSIRGSGRARRRRRNSTTEAATINAGLLSWLKI
jgi:hypothetical protein